MKNLMISISGIRGVFGVGLTPHIALQVAAVFGTFTGGGKVVVGRDSRTTGEVMLHSIKAGLIGVGCSVIDLGIVATPTVLLAVKHHKAQGGIAITASHNPQEWNAMKFACAAGTFLPPSTMEDFISQLSDKPKYKRWDRVGKAEFDEDATKRHVDKVLSAPFVNVGKIQVCGFKVAIDNVNGAGGAICKLLLKKLGCSVVELNTQPTGFFAHPPEPLAKNLGQLKDLVKKSGADIGFATDPDVDRLSIVNQRGVAIGEERTLPICMDFVLSQKRGDVVCNLSSSMVNDWVAKKHGVKLHKTAVGEINVSCKMLKILSPIGGEGNGGVILPCVNTTRDAASGIALVLGAMAESKQKISDIDEAMPSFFFAKDKIKTQSEKMKIVMKKVPKLVGREGFLQGDIKIEETDGVKFIAQDSWVHIRKSGTEPIVRIFVEATTRSLASQICQFTKSFLQEV